ncbi:hypothetical protein PR202_ga08009 [Eleusine coracana subsp. coracana]|uniref:Uncharacterized protein n=1 Tax=Eleusine coracana subsp. coracana TaxID=191504 RepID=A0AAV5C122_ELECO|nr:hypothetical protein PR202_ga08009 [Eleusine coracana subsp. coracana]
MRTTRCDAHSSGRASPRHREPNASLLGMRARDRSTKEALASAATYIQNGCLLVKLIHRLHTATDSSGNLGT